MHSTMVLPPTALCEHDQMADSGRGQWNNDLQFLLTCVGYAVGLGNIWRFPYLAYENGGGAFLFPYVVCSVLVGLPMLHMELCLGQFSSCGPATVFKRIIPALQGVGWAMAAMTMLVAIYYNVIIAWVSIYLVTIISGNSYTWTLCTNSWNTAACTSTRAQENCETTLPGSTYFNGSCLYPNTTLWAAREFFFKSHSRASPFEEFYERFVLDKSDSMYDLGGMNWKLVGALAVVWMITALCLAWGVKYVGRISLFTATFPYVIIVILFIRGVTLEGAQKGIDYYLLKPDWSYLAKASTWRAAATQVCYSLSIGFGGILSLSSYNSFNHNCFRDAVIVCLSDSFMSAFGGTAVFSILGFMATRMNVSISDVLQSGTGLAFIAYPEAMSNMPVSWLWSLLFFTMLFTLGFSTQFGLTEVVCTAICDQFPSMRPRKYMVVFGCCFFMFIVGLLLCTRAGIFYFRVFDQYSASFALMLLVFSEIAIIFYVYGIKNFIADIRMMVGKPKNMLTRVFGPSGYYFMFIWCVIAPIASLIIFGFSAKELIEAKLTYGRGVTEYVLPAIASVVGWAITAFTLAFIPIFFVYNVYSFSKSKKSLRELFMVQPKWRSYDRIQKQKVAGKVQPMPEFGLQAFTQPRRQSVDVSVLPDLKSSISNKTY